ncbi:hypothetical protein PRZ48_005701 [Zasmidium cellare]|uniref:Alpha/beta hydrolase fold-3 domain-containing protein n=1 Tax=Zasmidium cellare TaxID=395010 RepID=A0ABR0EL33_ZASCE|nr:hypothetical protein PRZ48_005701 [Zasmidium cellare]
MPDYRLLAESCGKDILADVDDFWLWLLSHLQEYLPRGSNPDLEGILLIGESAGGFLALQSVLRSPVDIFAAMILEYPMIDLREPHYTQDYEKVMWDPPFPQFDRKIFEHHMATLTNAGGPVTNATGFGRMNLAFVVSQRGLYEGLLGSDPSIYPLDIIHEVDRLPPTWLIHGTGDTIVPIAGTHKFVREVFKQLPDWKLHTSFMKGEHMFDKMDQRVSTKTDWVAAGISFISSSWMSTRRALS